MTRKTRRSKADGNNAEKREAREAAVRAKRSDPEAQSPEEASVTEDESASESGPSEPGATPSSEAKSEKKVTLPAFGFAKDLLRKTDSDTESRSEETSQDPAPEEPSASAESAGAEEKSSAPESNAVAAARGLDEADPRRIFAFADGLERGAAEPEAAPVRLETWVTFSLAGEVFALPVTPVREVVRVAAITRVPHAPKPIRGVTNRRGRVIPVIDLRLRIELPETELGRASRVIVVSSRGRLLGLLVDAVHQVVHIDLAKVQPPPDDVMTVQSDYLSGVYHMEDQLILLLDIDRAMIIREAAPEVSGGSPLESEPTEAQA